MTVKAGAHAAPLRICDWDRCFENNRTRQVDALTWVRLPVKSDSDGYVRFIEMGDPQKSLALFGAWTALVKVAARCKPRGVLVRNGVTPLTPSDLARRANMGADFAPFFAEMIERAKKVGWLVSLTDEEVDRLRKGEPLDEIPDAKSSPEDDDPSSPERQSGVSRASPERQSGVSQVTPDHHSVSGNGKLTREDFETIWSAFPKSRRIDKEKCFSLCAAHVKAGRKVAELAEATGRYAKAVTEAGTPPKFIQLPKTFFGATGRILDAMEPDFVERFVKLGDGASTKPKQKRKPGETWAEIYGEEYTVVKAERTGKLQYFTHGDWHDVPEGTKVHKA